MPRVSVIIPAYNAERYLAETLASIKAQTFGDWEAIVADDGSTDRTVETAEAFGERFKVLGGAANSGPAAARNRAIGASTGELLAFLDADDLWVPTYLERMVAIYDQSRARGVRTGIVACDARLLGPGGFFAQTYMDLMRFPAEVTVTRILVSNPIFVAAVSSRALVDEAGGFCPELFGTEDYDLWLRILELGYRVVATREPLSIYRQGPASVSSDPARMARSLQLTYRRALDRGRLTPGQQRIARRQLRLQRALEQVGLAISDRSAGLHSSWRLARYLPLFLRVAIENPDRWLTAARTLTGRGSPLAQITK